MVIIASQDGSSIVTGFMFGRYSSLTTTGLTSREEVVGPGRRMK